MQPDESSAYEQPSRVRHPVRLRVAGRVAAQGEHVADAGVGVLADDVAQLGHRVVDGGESARPGVSVVSRGDPLDDLDACGRGWTRRRRRSPTRRSAAAPRAAGSASHSWRSPSSVLGGKNSNENERWPDASSRRRMRGRDQPVTRRRHARVVTPARVQTGHPCVGSLPVTRDSGSRSLDVEGLRAVACRQALDAFLRARPRCSTRSAPTSARSLTSLADLCAGGKRLRPAFCYWGWRGAGGADATRS